MAGASHRLSNILPQGPAATWDKYKDLKLPTIKYTMKGPAQMVYKGSSSTNTIAVDEQGCKSNL